MGEYHGFSFSMMMMNCFCGMTDQQKVFSLISICENCQRSYKSGISDTLRAGFEPVENLSSGLLRVYNPAYIDLSECWLLIKI